MNKCMKSFNTFLIQIYYENFIMKSQVNKGIVLKILKICCFNENELKLFDMKIWKE